MKYSPDTDERRRRTGVRISATFALMLLAPAFAFFLSSSPASATSQGAVSGTVYVTNLNINSVTSINASNAHATVLHASNPQLNGPLGIAIAPDGLTAYVTNSGGNTVRPIDLQTTPPSFEAPIKVGGGPAAIAIAPNGVTAYVTNFNSNTVSPINLQSGKAGAPIAVGSGPWSIAVSPSGGFVCVSNSEATSVSVINTATRAVTTLPVSSAPQAIAIAPDGATAYVANGSIISVINLASSPPSLKGSISVPGGPLGIAITPDGKTAITANNDNTVTPINLTTSPASAGAPLSVGSLSQPDGIAISPDGKTAYVANATNTVTPINLVASTPRAEAAIQVGSPSFGIAIAPGQAPSAHLTVIPAAAGKSSTFDASGSKLSGGTDHELPLELRRRHERDHEDAHDDAHLHQVGHVLGLGD